MDQLSEIVAYIKSNKSLIEQVTTTKVNVSDIINNLTTNDGSKPLSAAMGVELKRLVDELNKKLTDKTEQQKKDREQDDAIQKNTESITRIDRKDEEQDTKISNNTEDILKLQIKEKAVGKAISVSDSAEFPFVDYKVFGETEHYTGGKPSPSVEHPSPLVSKTLKEIKVTGINLLKQPYLLLQNDTTINGVNVHINADYSITLKGTATAETYIELDKISGKFNQNVVAPSTNNGYSIVLIGNKESHLNFHISSHLLFLFVTTGKTVNETVYPMITLEAYKDKSYEPYKEQVVTLSQPVTLRGLKNESGDYLLDSIIKKGRSLGSKKCNRRKKFVGDISENWNSDTFGGKQGYYIAIENATQSFDEYALSNMFVRHERSKPYADNTFCVETRLNAISPTGYTTIESFKELLKTKPLVIVFKLNKETFTTLPQADQQALEKLHTFYPNTVIMTEDSTGQELTYVADPKNYIDKKLKQIVKANVRSTANLLSLMPLDTQASMIENDTNNILHDMEVTHE